MLPSTNGEARGTSPWLSGAINRNAGQFYRPFPFRGKRRSLTGAVKAALGGDLVADEAAPRREWAP